MPIRDNALEFKQDLDKFRRTLHLTLSEVVRMVVFELLRMIVVKTPVDTGRAAGSWMVRGGEPDDFVLPESAQMSQDEAIAAVMERVRAVNFEDLKQVFWIFNNLPYIQVLEYGLYPNPPKRGSYVKGQGWVIKSVGGYSKQAPAGMVFLSILELETKMDYIVRFVSAGGAA